jgi:glycosyltransferase involved in cell wall biosynthesis
MIVILTLANKPKYLPEAVASLDAQTRRDFRHVLRLDDGSRDWEGRYPPAVFFNEQAYICNQDDYIYWLSDDDLFLPNCLADLAGYLDVHPEIGCCYGGSRVELLFEDGSPSAPPQVLPAEGWPIFDAGFLPGCRIDEGMIMVRRSVLGQIEYPWMDEDPHPWRARLTDAHVMNKIAVAVGIYPIEKQVMINRVTPISAHCQARAGIRDIVDWRGAPKWNEPTN